MFEHICWIFSSNRALTGFLGFFSDYHEQWENGHPGEFTWRGTLGYAGRRVLSWPTGVHTKVWHHCQTPLFKPPPHLGSTITSSGHLFSVCSCTNSSAVVYLYCLGGDWGGGGMNLPCLQWQEWVPLKATSGDQTFMVQNHSGSISVPTQIVDTSIWMLKTHHFSLIIVKRNLGLYSFAQVSFEMSSSCHSASMGMSATSSDFFFWELREKNKKCNTALFFSSPMGFSLPFDITAATSAESRSWSHPGCVWASGSDALKTRCPHLLLRPAGSATQGCGRQETILLKQRPKHSTNPLK